MMRPGSVSIPDVESLAAGLSVVALGSGVLIAIGGAGSGSLSTGMMGAALAAVGLVVLASGSWIDPFQLLALSLPLPALLSGPDLRVAPAALITAVVLLAWFLRRAPDRRHLRLGAIPLGPVLVMGVAVVLSTAFALDRGAALRESVNWFVLITLLVAAHDQLSAAPYERSLRLAGTVSAVLAVTGSLAVLECLGVLPGRFPLPETRLFRATGGFGWPNELGMFLAVGIPISVFSVRAAATSGSRLLAMVGLAAASMGLLATFSRGSWLALIGATPILFLFEDRRRVLHALGVAGITLVLMQLLTGGAVVGRIAATVDDPYVVQRMALTLTGLLMFRDNPIVGVGPGGFASSLEDFGPQVTWLWDYVGSAHNAYVEIAAEMGLVGLAAFLAFVTISLARLVRSARDDSGEREERALRGAVAWSFAVVCLVSLTGWPLAHGIGQLIMLVLALGFVLHPRGESGG